MIKNLDPVSLGEVLNLYLTTHSDYSKYTNINFNNSNNLEVNVRTAISNAYKNLNISFFKDDGSKTFDLLQSKILNTSDIQASDIIIINDKKVPKYYCITSYIGNSIVTYPRLSGSDKDNVLYGIGIKQFKIIRPDINSIDEKNMDEINSLITDTFPKIQEEVIGSNKETFKSLSRVDLPEGYLQIGDLVFIVEPTQLSFTTNNGYSYFPTLRTQGNPKIPTMQQVKNVSISLIFPNQDSINYQLLNLFAMYRRTPFVSIYNKDINEFFKDLSNDNGGFLPVALESINIRSVEGFPNTLQADITILPFDPKVVGGSFQALRTMSDVANQQSILFIDKSAEEQIKLSESKMEEQSIRYERYASLVGTNINKTYDFYESLPFRAFYQSLISDRNFVLDPLGNVEYTYSIDGVAVNNNGFNLSQFRPVKSDHCLFHYDSINNDEPIKLSYTYISGEIRDAMKNISNSVIDYQSQSMQKLLEMHDLLSDSDSLLNQLIVTFDGAEKFFREYEYRFSEMDNTIQEFLAMHNIEINSPEGKDIKNLMDFTIQSFSHGIGWSQIKSGVSQLNSIIKGEYTLHNNQDDLLNLDNNLMYYGSKDDGILNSDTVKPARAVLKELVDKVWKNVSTGSNEQQELKKNKLTAFLTSIGNKINGDLTNDFIRATDDVNNPFQVYRIPTVTTELIIDNECDVITGWNLTFSNKLIPIYLQAYKYPYYQHMGSDDVNISLSIRSVPPTYDKKDFKSELSLLSERLYNSVKLTTLTAPELMTYIDPRLYINVPIGHLFRSFGLSKVVFNNSSTVNVPNSPNSWNTTLSLTQANFSLDQYHKIEQVNNTNSVEQEIALLLLRTQFDPIKNEVKIYKYSEIKNFVQPVQYSNLEITDFDILARVTFFKSKHANRLRDHIDSLLGKKTTDPKLASSFITNQDALKNIVYEDIDGPKTITLNTLMRENENFSKVIKEILFIIDEIISDQTDALINSIVEDKTFFENLKLVIKSRTDKYFGGSELLAFLTFGAVISKLNPFIAVPSIILSGGSILAESLINDANEKIKSQFSSFIQTIINSYKKSSIFDIAHKIITDPVISNKLIKTNVLGIESANFIKDQYRKNYVNCYNDFDLPELYKTNSLEFNDFIGSSIKISPDFFMYNSIDTDFELQEYISTGIKRLAKIGKLGSMISLFDTAKVVSSFDSVIKTIEDESQVDQITKTVKEEIGYKENLAKTLNNLQAIYVDQVLSDTQYDKENIVKVKIESLITESKKSNPKMTETEENNLRKELSNSFRFEDTDARKINLIQSARSLALLELYTVYNSINSIMVEMSTDTKNVKNKYNPLNKVFQDYSNFDEVHKTVKSILENAKTIDTDSLISKKITSGEYSQLGTAIVNRNISLPEIKNLQNWVFSKIGTYIRLNTVLKQYNQTQSVASIDWNLIPEFKYLDWWNFREIEDNVRKIALMKEFLRVGRSVKNTTMKMFPTFKVYFIEEDKGISYNLDDYYTYNAIQSIEITTNKNRASKVARLVISNVTGTITDQFSFMRERQDFLGIQDIKQPDNIFFGTLDVKPGTSILIKMGYSANDVDLDTVFIGRILEMNVGPVCEVIAQSYSAQLNHEVISHKFGLFGDVKGHGDVATALLDMIPGLENLGKKNIMSSTTSNISGRGFYQLGGNIADRLLLSNLFGSISALNFAQDNPRDENIYLPYDLKDKLLDNPTFDWVVFNQTVWNSLQELCLYHKNSSPIIRTYNDDSRSSKNDLRETLILGDKSGYYKYTDAFTFSSQNRNKIDSIISNWNNISSFIDTDDKPLTQVQTLHYFVNPNFYKVWGFFSNWSNCLVVASHILKNINYDTNLTVTDILGTQLSKFNPFSKETKIQKLLSNLKLFTEKVSINEEELPNTVFSKGIIFTNYDNSFNVFKEIIILMREIFKDNKITKTIVPESVYNVSTILDNTDPSLASDPRYRKIQKHHLISDIDDIINNNISLSTDFANMVNLYYFNEPKMVTTEGIGLTDRDKINVWPVKAFGDIKDDQLRTLDIFQKNIDTNWFEVSSSVSRFFNQYKPKNSKDSGRYQYMHTKGDTVNIDGQTINLKMPDWRAFPSFVTVGINILKNEISKMYQGTIEIIGNPDIEPHDILHIQDYINDMHGAVEVEEVTHIFTPDKGFRTIIVPNLIVYDRDPIQLQDISVINEVLEFANTKRRNSMIRNTVFAGAALGAGIYAGKGSPGGFILGGLGALPFLYAGTVGNYFKYHKFLFDSFANVMGRDCVNFSTLIYHGAPYIAGFDGVDYTNLKTLINHGIEGISDPISRLAAYSDPFAAAFTTDFNPSEFGVGGAIASKIPALFGGKHNWVGLKTTGKLHFGF